MAEVKLMATVTRGKLVPEAPTVWAVSLGELEGKRVSVTLETERSARSLRQNSYWWAVCVPIFQEVWSRGRVAANLPPYTKDETHAVLVEGLLPCEDGPMPGTRVRVRSSKLTTEQFTKLIDAAREYAWQQYRMAIPAPGEQWEVSA